MDPGIVKLWLVFTRTSEHKWTLAIVKAEVNLSLREWANKSAVNELKLCKMADQNDVAVIITFVVENNLSGTFHIHDRCTSPF